MINKSESIVKLAIALAKFNTEVGSISKDASNPFFKKDYVTLDKLIISTKDILAKNGLSVMQFPTEREGMVGVITILTHESGEFIESAPFYLKPVKNDPQSYGSAITYARRYSYQAVLSLNTGEDDDAHCAVHYKKEEGEEDVMNEYVPKRLSEAQIKRLYAIAAKASVEKSMVLKAIKQEFKVEKAELLTKEQYDELCARLEKKIK